MVRVRATLLLLVLLGVVGGGRAHAQASLEAVPVQGLSFGALIPGTSETIVVSDAGRRAEILLTGDGVFDFAIVLPQALISRTGARLPLRFGPRDGALLPNLSSALIPINPLETNRVRLQSGGPATRLLIGGTALPTREQPAGQYATTVTIVVINAGT